MYWYNSKTSPIVTDTENELLLPISVGLIMLFKTDLVIASSLLHFYFNCVNHGYKMYWKVYVGN